jgi:hypothetical protein
VSKKAGQTPSVRSTLVFDCLPLRISLDVRHGFEVMGTIQVGNSPVVTPMIRHQR